MEYIDEETFIGDLRRYVKHEPVDVKESQIRDIREVKLNMNRLVEELGSFKEKIARIYYWQDKELMPKFADLIEDKDLKKKLNPLGVEEKG